MCLLLACGCQPKTTAGAGAPPPPLKAAGIGKGPASTAAKASKPYRIALIMKASINPFFKTMEVGGQRAAAELGIELLAKTIRGESDCEQQIGIVESMIAQKVDAILIAPADSKALVQPLKSAQDAGSPVINVDNRLDSTTMDKTGLKLISYVGADNEEGGRLAGEHLCELLGGAGKVAMLEGIRGVDNAEARKRGFGKACAAAPGITIAASDTARWDLGEGQAKFSAMLSAHPDLTGLFCANDNMALGAIAAIGERGMTGKITVVSYDNIDAAKKALRDGRLAATIEQHPDLMGYESVKAAVDHLEGREVKPEVLVPLEVITKENVDA
jgi:ribose transport system substrate-binding protein